MLARGASPQKNSKSLGRFSKTQRFIFKNDEFNR